MSLWLLYFHLNHYHLEKVHTNLHRLTNYVYVNILRQYLIERNTILFKFKFESTNVLMNNLLKDKLLLNQYKIKIREISNKI